MNYKYLIVDYIYKRILSSYHTYNKSRFFKNNFISKQMITLRRMIICVRADNVLLRIIEIINTNCNKMYLLLFLVKVGILYIV